MSQSRCITEPGVVISGASVYLLSQLLRSPRVGLYLRSAAWLRSPDFDAALRDIHTMADAWQATVELRQRGDAVRCEDGPLAGGTVTVEEACRLLGGLGKRRVQELAHSKRIAGRRVGQRWALSKASVIAHRERKGRVL